MIWKPKEKELSKEEAVTQAKHELAPFWLGIEPQVVGIESAGSYFTLPLDDQFLKKSWLIFFFDPTEYSGQTACEFGKEWYRRYHPHALEFLFFIITPYENWKVRETILEYKDNFQCPFPVAVDIDQSIFRAFGGAFGGAFGDAFRTQGPPMLLLLTEGKQYFKYHGKNWINDTELNIQEFLRTKDPGLPLLPVYQSTLPEIHDIKRLEFGYAPTLGREAPFFEKPGFIPTAEGYRLGRFHNLPSLGSAKNEISISGEWIQEKERMMTQDPNAFLSLINQGSIVSLIAQSMSRTTDSPMITITIDGVPAYENVAGEHLSLEDSGQSVLRVKKAQVYHLLKNLPVAHQQIHFSFQNANLAPVALYGLRFGDL